jgi:glycosyltransferase involved in cell wall biosynthesis
MGMLVSAIVPVYNVAPWLREAVDSLVQQTYEPVEIILVDDGSTDESGRICDEYAQRWPERVQTVHQENRGLSGARNTGLDRMHGEAVVFLDPDDSFDVKMIERMMNAQGRYQAEVVICGHAVYRSAQRQKNGAETQRTGVCPGSGKSADEQGSTADACRGGNQSCCLG